MFGKAILLVVFCTSATATGDRTDYSRAGDRPIAAAAIEYLDGSSSWTAGVKL